MKLRIIILSIILSILPSCHQKQFNKIVAIKCDSPLTVFIHGTLFNSITSMIVHAFDCPFGFNCAQTQGNKYLMGRIPYILDESCHQQFPVDSFYLFGWSGKLSFEERKKAAKDLYHCIKDHKGPITIIGHSHGCNVALSLAQIAKEENNLNFIIDRLILLAGPVQHVTETCIQSNIFKKIYSFYSSADMMQVLDPQAVYDATKELNLEDQEFFSKRTFKTDPKLFQIRILFNGQSISHIDFILESFIKKLPKIIDMVNNLDPQHQNYKADRHYIVNIKSGKKDSHFVQQNDLSQSFIPRNQNSRSS